MINNMKKKMMVAAMVMFGLLSANAAGNSEKNCQQERELVHVDLKGPTFLQDYIKIKNALVEDNTEQVRLVALIMQEHLGEAEVREEQHDRLKETAKKLSDAGNIEEQRKYFAELSLQLYELLENTSVTGKTLYLQHCTMALDGEGGYWLSYDKQVRNPFMGQRMPGCGSLQENIER